MFPILNDKYEILKYLDDGATSRVYLAREIENHQNQVALKILKDEHKSKFDLNEFNSETQILS